jgi:hypothetical protein
MQRVLEKKQLLDQKWLLLNEKYRLLDEEERLVYKGKHLLDETQCICEAKGACERIRTGRWIDDCGSYVFKKKIRGEGFRHEAIAQTPYYVICDKLITFISPLILPNL